MLWWRKRAEGPSGMLRSMALVLTKKPVRDPGPAMRRYHLELQLLMLVCLRLDFMEHRLALNLI